MANLTKLQHKKIEKKETVNVILAIPPSEKINNVISAFVRTEFGEDVAVEISVKPEILGGAIFIFEGFYRDYSLLMKLEDAFENKRSEIEKSISEVRGEKLEVG